MNPPDMDALLENEREWRRYLIERIELMTKEISTLKADALVTKIVGGSLFALMLALIGAGWKFGR